MERKIKLFLFIFFGSFVFLSSCKKESTAIYLNNNNTSADQIKLLIGQVKNWHDSIVQVKSTPSTDSKIKSFSFSEASEDLNIKEINWSAGYLNYDTIGKKGISVPLFYDASTGVNLQLVTSIVKGKVTGYIVKTAPTLFYHKIHKDRYDFTLFTGTVSVYNLTGKFINKVEFEEGEPVNQNKLKNNQVSVATMADLPEVTVIGYRHDPIYLELYPFELACLTCGDSELGTTSGGGAGSIFIGGNEAAAATPKIENLVKDTCLANIVQKIIEKDLANVMSQRILSIFDKSETMNLYFVDRSTNVNNEPGNFRLNYDPKNEISNYTIYLDLTKISNASNEYKASVIIHEITHAIIRSNLTSEENKLLGESGKHYLMLQNYIEEMKAFLQETFTLNDEEALSMIFEGIADLAPIPDGSNHDENVFVQLLKKYNLSNIPGDLNSFTNVTQDFKNGIRGTKNCK